MLENTLTVEFTRALYWIISRPGMSLQIYHDLKLDNLDCSVAIIKNAKSNKMGKKILSKWNVRLKRWIWIFSVLSIIIFHLQETSDSSKKIKNVIRCKNPRCITSIEQGLDHVFVLD